MNEGPQTAPVIRFEPFEVNLASGELRKNGEKVKLPEQSFQILAMLLERPGEVVLRREIQKRLWPNDTVVEFENSINAAIKRLRLALGDSADHPRYIETLARRGYRWMVPVQWAEANTFGCLAPGPSSLSPLAASSAGASLIGRRVSHYRVLEILGGGGMGVVYKAEDIRLSRQVALKFLPEELASDAAVLQRFDREARAASALNHPNICTIYEVEEHEGKPFIVMELLEGQTLRERIAAAPSPGPAGHLLPAGEGNPHNDSVSPLPEGEGPGVSGRPLHGRALPIDQLLDVAIQIAEGLDAAHQKGITHRDIKPANIFINRRGQLKILDFGLAKLVGGAGVSPAFEKEERAGKMSVVPGIDPHLTKTGVAMGTAPYMSPEQVRGEKLDARTDLFSFGLVLYEMAIGRQAFGGDTAAAIHQAILHQEPTPARELNPDLPPKLEEIINKALEKDRGLRYQTAADLRAKLKELKHDMDSRDAVGLLGVAPPLQRPWLWMLAAVAFVFAAVGAVTLYLGRYRHAPTEVSDRQITANPPEDWIMGAAISPDGKRIAYNDQTGLYIRSIDSGETHAVSLPEGFQKLIWDVEWFPDGGKLLAGVLSGTGADLWVINLLGDAAPQLLHRHAAWPAISPDGRLIAFVRGEERKVAVWVGGIDGEAPRKLAEEESSMASPAWSPDGRWIAYASWKETAEDPPRTDVEVRRAGGGPAKTFQLQSGLPQSSSLCIPVIHCLQWSRDWRLVFSTGQNVGSPSGHESYSVWEVAVKPSTLEAAGKAERLAHWNDFPPQDLTLTADGKRLSFLKTRQWQDVYLSELGADGASMKLPRRFTLDNRGIESLDTWTRDSRAIFFSSNRNGRPEIFRQGVNQGVGETIAQGPDNRGSVALSSDGSWMLYEEWSSTALPTPHRLMCRPAVGGSPEVVLEEPAGSSWDYACPLKPGSPCVLRRLEGAEFVFYSLDPMRGRGEQLGRIQAPPPGAYSGFSVSPDGSRLALVRGTEDYKGRIDVLTFSGHAWHEIPVEPTWGLLQSIAWTADGKGFFVTSNLPELKNLLHVTLDGRVRPVLHYDQRQFMTHPLPSPDGKYLAFQATTWDSNVWMIENF